MVRLVLSHPRCPERIHVRMPELAGRDVVDVAELHALSARHGDVALGGPADVRLDREALAGQEALAVVAGLHGKHVRGALAVSDETSLSQTEYQPFRGRGWLAPAAGCVAEAGHGSPRLDAETQ
jgi:hypothetical protein